MSVAVDLSMMMKSWTVGHSPSVPQEVHEVGVKVGGLSLFFFNDGGARSVE